MIGIVCGVRATHVPTGVTAEVAEVCMVSSARLRAVVLRVLRQRLWTRRNTPLPLSEAARYEFDGDGYAEFERAEDVLEARLLSGKR